MDRVVFLLDMDAFFASCHISKHPEYFNKNLVVSSPNKRAIISTASYNARKFGIKAGMPLFKANELCKDIFVVTSDFNLYSKMSNDIFEYLEKNYCKNIQVGSIDECYMDVTNEWRKYGTVKKMAQAILTSIQTTFNLTCSIGISSNKFLAKMCVDFNKPNGISFLLPENIETELWPLKIEKMLGVGEVTKTLFNENNIFTINDLVKIDLNTIIKKYGKRGYSLWLNANGRGIDNWEGEYNEPKSIGNEMTLDEPITNEEEIDQIIYELCFLINTRLKKRFLSTKTVCIIFKYKKNYRETVFSKRENLKHHSFQETLLEATSDVEVIYSVLDKLFYEKWNGSPISLLGVKVSKLRNDLFKEDQLTLTDLVSEKKLIKDYNNKVIYNINSKYGKNILFTGESLIKVKEEKENKSKYSKNDGDRLSMNDLKIKWKD